MSYNQAEKMEIIRMVESSPLSVKQTLKQIKVSKSSFYKWYRKYLDHGYDGLANKYKIPNKVWNRIPDIERERIVELALSYPEESPREIALRMTDKQGYFVSESSVYRILKERDLVTSPNFIINTAKDEFEDKTTRINEMWQADFTYLRIIDWGWYYLLTIMDDFSRFILAWKLCLGMTAEDVKSTLDIAIQKIGIDTVPVAFRPGLLSDNGSSFISKALKEYLDEYKMWHTRGKPYHPQTQGKIERYHRSMKNILLLDIYYSPGELEKNIAAWVEHYNNHRYHESIDNVTPADKYYGRAEEILKRREAIKMTTMLERRMINMKDLTMEKIILN
jgi:transposase InsO family protein